MTTFSFNPTDIDSCETALEIIAHFQPHLDLEAGAPPATQATTATTTVADVAFTQAAAATAAAAAAAAATGATSGGTPDELGMLHDPAIHQTPPKLKSDGCWTGKRGQAPALAAAITAHQAGVTQAAGASMTANVPETTTAVATGGMPTPGAGGMPTPGAGGMPAVGASTTPAAPLTFEQVSTRFMANIEALRINDAQIVYEHLQIGEDMATNQTSLQRLWHYCAALEGGSTHGDAVTRAIEVVNAQNAG